MWKLEDLGGSTPRGASAESNGSTLMLKWPSTADQPPLMVAIVGSLVGVVAGIALSIFARWPVGASIGGGAVVVGGLVGLGARLVPRSKVSLTIGPQYVSVKTSGLSFALPVTVARSDVRDVLAIDEEDGTDSDGQVQFKRRIVAVMKDGGRVILVSRVVRPEFGSWVEACFATWSHR